MDEHREEQATSYVLGAMPESERPAFEQALARDPALRALVSELQTTLGEWARTLPQQAPSPALKARVMKRIAAAPARTPVERKRATAPAPVVRFPAWIPWAAAAVFVLSSFWLWAERTRLREQVAVVTNRQSVLEKSLAAMDQEAATLRARAAAAATEADALRGQAGVLERTIASVREELIRARQAADLANMQVARLASVAEERSQALAVSLWNQTSQQGVLLVENLPALSEGKTYEFWVIDPATAAPISAGVFATDAEGRGRIVFRPKVNVRTAAQFAISVEPPGGSPQAGPTGPVVMAGAATSF